MIRAKQKRVERRPLVAEGQNFQDGVGCHLNQLVVKAKLASNRYLARLPNTAAPKMSTVARPMPQVKGRPVANISSTVDASGVM